MTCRKNVSERSPSEMTDQQVYGMRPGTSERAVRPEETGEKESEEDVQK